MQAERQAGGQVHWTPKKLRLTFTPAGHLLIFCASDGTHSRAQAQAWKAESKRDRIQL